MKASKVIEEETGVEPSMSEDDMKEYLRMVVEEIQAARESSGK
jgi:hypothetical protein